MCGGGGGGDWEVTFLVFVSCLNYFTVKFAPICEPLASFDR